MRSLAAQANDSDSQMTARAGATYGRNLWVQGATYGATYRHRAQPTAQPTDQGRDLWRNLPYYQADVPYSRVRDFPYSQADFPYSRADVPYSRAAFPLFSGEGFRGMFPYSRLLCGCIVMARVTDLTPWGCRDLGFPCWSVTPLRNDKRSVSHILLGRPGLEDPLKILQGAMILGFFKKRRIFEDSSETYRIKMSSV